MGIVDILLEQDGLIHRDQALAAERRTIDLLRHAGITGWAPNLPLRLPGWGLAVVDLAFPEHRLVVEVDGWAYHRDVDRFRSDARRQNAIVVAGWRVLRVTWYALIEDPVRVLTTVTGALAHSS